MPSGPYKTWDTPDGALWAAFFREGGDSYRIRFPDLADFTFGRRTDRVLCHPVPGTDDDTIQHLFLNQVLPLVRGMQGRLVLHASAVEVAGRTVLFIGLSGRGKSTLSSWFATCGHRLVSDDGVVFAEDDFRVEPGHRSVRLWADSLEAVLGTPAGERRHAAYSGKSRILDPGGIAFAEAPGPVAAVFHLGEPAEDIAVERLSPRAALAECLPHLFLLDDRDGAILAAHFDKLSALCNQVPQFRLHYPRRFDNLGPLRSDILASIPAEGCPE